MTFANHGIVIAAGHRRSAGLAVKQPLVGTPGTDDEVGVAVYITAIRREAV
jgi:hypothetical protein